MERRRDHMVRYLNAHREPMQTTHRPQNEAADRLAYVCAKAIMRGDIRTRSVVDDALLDYLGVGGIDGPEDVPSWVEEYERTHSVY